MNKGDLGGAGTNGYGQQEIGGRFSRFEYSQRHWERVKRPLSLFFVHSQWSRGLPDGEIE